MKNRTILILIAGLFAGGGCSTPVSVSGAYSTTNQTVGGSVTVGKP